MLRNRVFGTLTLAMAASLVLGGCAAQVHDAGLSSHAGVLTAYYDVTPQTEFRATDGVVTLTAHVGRSLVETPFKVAWVNPRGRVQLKEGVRRIPGTDAVTASMPIREAPAASMPGRWRVRMYRGVNLVLEQPFTIE